MEGRSHRSVVQGRIHLKLTLSTRDNTHQYDDDDLTNYHDMQKMERVLRTIMSHELATHEPSWTWSGDLPAAALAILHQLQIQCDLTDLQYALTRFIAAVQLNRCTPIDSKFIHRLLLDVDRLWNLPNQNRHIPKDVVPWMAEALTFYVEKSKSQIRQHRDIFPALHPPSLIRMEYMLRCMGLLGTMKAFRTFCPFHKGIRGEMVSELRKGTVQWAHFFLRQETNRQYSTLLCFATTLIASLQLGLTYYHPLFDSYVFYFLFLVTLYLIHFPTAL